MLPIRHHRDSSGAPQVNERRNIAPRVSSVIEASMNDGASIDTEDLKLPPLRNVGLIEPQVLPGWKRQANGDSISPTAKRASPDLGSRYTPPATDHESDNETRQMARAVGIDAHEKKKLGAKQEREQHKDILARCEDLLEVLLNISAHKKQTWSNGKSSGLRGDKTEVLVATCHALEASLIMNHILAVKLYGNAAPVSQAVHNEVAKVLDEVNKHANNGTRSLFRWPNSIMSDRAGQAECSYLTDEKGSDLPCALHRDNTPLSAQHGRKDYRECRLRSREVNTGANLVIMERALQTIGGTADQAFAEFYRRKVEP